MAEKKKAKGWSLADMQGTLVKDTEQRIEQGFREIADTKGSGTSVSLQPTTAEMPEPKQVPNAGQQQAPVIQPMRKIGAHAEQQSVYQEPTQNINIPIPSSQHVRLKVISATSRQTMKDMVVQAIGLWLDVQEGKKIIKNE